MRAVVQRVKEARVRVDQKTVGAIQSGLLVLLGIHKEDREESVEWLSEKLLSLRIFSDERGKFQHDLAHVKGEILVVSQFTLYGACTKGRRPDFSEAASPEHALFLYEKFLRALKKRGYPPQSGTFGAKMEVTLVNDGPVTLILEH